MNHPLILQRQQQQQQINNNSFMLRRLNTNKSMYTNNDNKSIIPNNNNHNNNVVDKSQSLSSQSTSGFTTTTTNTRSDRELIIEYLNDIDNENEASSSASMNNKIPCYVCGEVHSVIVTNPNQLIHFQSRITTCGKLEIEAKNGFLNFESSTRDSFFFFHDQLCSIAQSTIRNDCGCSSSTTADDSSHINSQSNLFMQWMTIKTPKILSLQGTNVPITPSPVRVPLSRTNVPTSIETFVPTTSLIPTVTALPTYTNRCYICNGIDDTMRITIPNGILVAYGMKFTCQEIEKEGYTGRIAMDVCETFIQILAVESNNSCGCQYQNSITPRTTSTTAQQQQQQQANEYITFLSNNLRHSLGSGNP